MKWDEVSLMQTFFRDKEGPERHSFEAHIMSSRSSKPSGTLHNQAQSHLHLECDDAPRIHGSIRRKGHAQRRQKNASLGKQGKQESGGKLKFGKFWTFKRSET